MTEGVFTVRNKHQGGLLHEEKSKNGGDGGSTPGFVTGKAL